MYWHARRSGTSTSSPSQCHQSSRPFQSLYPRAPRSPAEPPASTSRWQHPKRTGAKATRPSTPRTTAHTTLRVSPAPVPILACASSGGGAPIRKLWATQAHRQRPPIMQTPPHRQASALEALRSANQDHLINACRRMLARYRCRVDPKLKMLAGGHRRCNLQSVW